MRHILTKGVRVDEQAIKFLHERREKKRKENAPPVRGPQDLSGQSSNPQLWIGPNIVCLGRGKRPPIPGQQDDEDTKKPLPGAREAASAGRKQNLRGFSQKSSLNISRLLSSIDWKKNGIPLHITLTYRDTWPKSKAELQLEKMALVQGLRRAGLVCGIWKLEFQTRETPYEKAQRIQAKQPRKKGSGSLYVPHWHILGWCEPSSIDQVGQNVAEWWGSHSCNEHPRAVDIRTGDTARASYYLSLHSAKDNQSPPFEVGRWWGYIEREKVIASVSIQDVGFIPRRELVWWHRLYCRFRHMRCPPLIAKGFGFSWFLPQDATIRAACWIRDRVEFEQFVKSQPF
jgi:hypothetical protein